ncbi:MAG: rhamnulokinase [candidate division KSB1 bacterium]|nr:rhamnulokinase [candidate division KSB1 bacterium]
MKRNYIAIDLGAGSGRVMLGTVNETVELQECHRFVNEQIKAGSYYYWDILRLFQEIKTGLRKAKQMADTPVSGIGVDTWGVDFGLLDSNGMLLSNPVCYRDPRTDGIMEKAFERLSEKSIYESTGLQFIQFNTMFQLMSMSRENPQLLKTADTLLMMPDLINYLLTGEIAAEYTIASTTQLLNAKTRTWDESLFQPLGLPFHIMPEITLPGNILGRLLPDIQTETGLHGVDVINTSGHDTACAVAAVPASGKNWAYLSSGTWSLIGIEISEPIITDSSRAFNFTNEGGVNRKIRFLKNVMGMWLLEGCIREWQKNGESISYEQLIKQAGSAAPFRSIINPDDHSFLNPPNMIKAIQTYCRNTDQPVPQSKGALTRSIFESLALRYRWALTKIQELRGTPIETLHIVGGGSKNDLLNQFTANATGCQVLTGPAEATATGNVLVQAIAGNDISSVEEGRKKISATLQTFTPEKTNEWDRAFEQAVPLLNA